MNIPGIYKIESKVHPERIYIGSAINIEERWRLHIYFLKRNKHHSSKLQRHYNKYGKIDLRFSILLGCDKDDLLINEQFFLDSLNPYFNVCKIAGSRLGIKSSEETKQKIRSFNLGKVMPDEIKLKIKKSMIGRVITDEHKKKIKERLTGKRKTPEHIEKMRIALTGKVHGKMSDETKKKLSLAKIGHDVSQETREKLRKFNLGKISKTKGTKMSPESIEKNRMAHLGQVAWNKRMNLQEQLEYRKSKYHVV